jgi:uncharacterized protein YjbJ (UPF0337 family)
MDKDRIEGTLKEQEGKLTDDKVREAQGKAEKTVGELKDKAEDLGDDDSDS